MTTYVIMGILLLGIIIVVKLLSGLFKMVLIVIVVGLLIATFANKEQIDAVPSLGVSTPS